MTEYQRAGKKRGKARVDKMGRGAKISPKRPRYFWHHALAAVAQRDADKPC